MALRCLFFLALLWTAVPAHAFPEYYEISDHAAAEKEAAERKLPLAWLGSYPECLSPSNTSTAGQLTRMAMATLKDRAVIIFFDGRDMAPVPANVHWEFHQQDDGPLPGGAAWKTPKVVFTDAAVTEMLARVSHTQMAENGAGALNSAMQIIRNNERLAKAKAAAPDPEVVAPKAAAPVKGGKESEVLGGISNAVDFIDLVTQYRLPIIAVGLAAFAALAGFIVMTRKK